MKHNTKFSPTWPLRRSNCCLNHPITFIASGVSVIYPYMESVIYFCCIYLCVFVFVFVFVFICVYCNRWESWKWGEDGPMGNWVRPWGGKHWVFCCQHTTGFMNNSKTQRATHRHTHKQKLTQLSIRLAYNWIYTKTSLSSLSPAEASLEGILCLNAAPHMDQLNSRWWKNFI